MFASPAHSPTSRFTPAILLLGLSGLLAACTVPLQAASPLGHRTGTAWYPTCENRITYLQSAATGLNGPLGDGTVRGGLTGYYREKQRQIEEVQERIGAYADDIQASTASINRNVGYANATFNCYHRQFDTLVSAEQGSTLPADEGRQRLAQIVNGLQRSTALFSEIDQRHREALERHINVYERDLQRMEIDRATVVAAVAHPLTGKSLRGKRRPAPLPEELLNTEQALQKAEARQALGEQALLSGEKLLSNICSHPSIDAWAPASCTQVKRL